MKMKEWAPHFPDLEPEPCFGEWSVIKVPNTFALDHTIRAAGWNFFFMATEVKAMYFGSPGDKKILIALRRILAKTNLQYFNGLEVTKIAARNFLGVPYVTLSAHSRHLQQSCNLDSAKRCVTRGTTPRGPEARVAG